MKKALNVGDKVAYSVQFLKSIGMSHTAAARARGVIERIEGSLIHVQWDNGDFPPVVGKGALAHVGPNRYFSNVD